jgi:hypothetical protein
MRLRSYCKLAACALCAIAWLMSAGGGLFALGVYGSTAGAPSTSPALWPANTAIGRSPERAALLVFLHPYCPCSQATLGELARLVRAAGGAIQVSVIILEPPDARDVRSTSLWKTAEQIPTVSVICDSDGRETSRFGARTSGAALLYDRSGRLRFHGGLTASRGHAGDNAGVDCVLAILQGESAPISTAVFGCSLFGDDSGRNPGPASEGKPCCK